MPPLASQCSRANLVVEILLAFIDRLYLKLEAERIMLGVTSKYIAKRKITWLHYTLSVVNYRKMRLRYNPLCG